MVGPTVHQETGQEIEMDNGQTKEQRVDQAMGLTVDLAVDLAVGLAVGLAVEQVEDPKENIGMMPEMVQDQAMDLMGAMAMKAKEEEVEAAILGAKAANGSLK